MNMDRRGFFRGLLQAACVAVASKMLPSSLVKDAPLQVAPIEFVNDELIEFEATSPTGETRTTVSLACSPFVSDDALDGARKRGWKFSAKRPGRWRLADWR